MISSSSLPRPFPFPFEEGGRAQEEFEDRRVRPGQSSLRKTVTNQPFSASPFSKCESEVLAGATFLGVERSASTAHRKAPLQFLLPFPSWSFALFPIPAHCPAKLPLPLPPPPQKRASSFLSGSRRNHEGNGDHQKRSLPSPICSRFVLACVVHGRHPRNPRSTYIPPSIQTPRRL